MEDGGPSMEGWFGTKHLQALQAFINVLKENDEIAPFMEKSP